MNIYSGWPRKSQIPSQWIVFTGTGGTAKTK